MLDTTLAPRCGAKSLTWNGIVWEIVFEARASKGN
jgi:hypothetical protein